MTYACCSRYYSQLTIKYNKPKVKDSWETSFTTQSPVKHLLKPLQNKAEGRIWHQQLGYIGKDIIKQLLQLVIGAILKGPITVEYKLYRVSKAHKLILRRQLTWSTVPFYKIHLDLIPKIIAYNSNQHAAHFLDNVTRMNEVEMMA